MLPQIIIVFASLSGALSVALGAFGAYGLRDSLSPRLMETFQTAVAYQMSHSLVLLGTGILMLHWGRLISLDTAAGAFALGILLFPGSLYLLVLTDMRWPGPVTPLGGLAFIIGWLALALAAFQKI